jgi:hypothetical protein
LAELCEFSPARITPEEQHVEPLLQEFHLMADGGARNAKLACRHAKGAKASGGFKCGKCTKGWEITAGQGNSPVGLSCSACNIAEMACLGRGCEDWW